MAPTTPTGSLTTFIQLGWPKALLSGRARSQAKWSICSAGHSRPSASGASSWAMVVTITGVPTSATSSGRNSSRSATMASWSWRRHCWRNFRSVDHPVSSKARRAATMARSMSWAVASVVCPMTSSVAGLMLSNPAPEDDSTSAPSMSIRRSLPSSDCVSEAAVVVMTLPWCGPVSPCPRRGVRSGRVGSGGITDALCPEARSYRAGAERDISAPGRCRAVRRSGSRVLPSRDPGGVA